jgi:hypothetical protein
LTTTKPINWLLNPNWIAGVLSMLELKPNELLVGSGDGSVSLVLDKSGLVAHPKRKPDGITRQLNEPTTSCLQEVRLDNVHK